jgi:RNA polymerase sigma factor (sigma-70 family)
MRPVALAKNDPEMDVLEAMARGDRQLAVTVLMRAYGDELYRHCRQMLGTDDLAQDVHQQVFVQAFRDLGTCARRSTFRAWLYGIARHRCLDELKASRRWHGRFVSATQLPDPTDPHPSAEEHLAARAEAERVAAALASLKPQVRAAVWQRFVEEMTFQEMAAVTGEAPGTLQARVSRAVPLLRAALAAMVVLAVALGLLLHRKSQHDGQAKQEAAQKARALADYETEMKALIANQAEQDALLDQYRSAATEEERIRIEEEIRKKKAAAEEIEARARDGRPTLERPRGTIKVACDPNDPLCGL